MGVTKCLERGDVNAAVVFSVVSSDADFGIVS